MAFQTVAEKNNSSHIVSVFYISSSVNMIWKNNYIHYEVLNFPVAFLLYKIYGKLMFSGEEDASFSQVAEENLGQIGHLLGLDPRDALFGRTMKLPHVKNCVMKGTELQHNFIFRYY